jgi:hypothetical protein
MVDRLDEALMNALGAVAPTMITWCETQKCRLSLNRELADGYTAARVFLVTLNPDAGPPSRIVLKVSPPEPWFHEEANRHYDAIQQASHELSNHIVRPLFDPLTSADRRIMFSELAFGGREIQSLGSKLPSSEVIRQACNVAQQLILGWRERINPQQQSPGDYLLEDLESWRLADDGPLVRVDAHEAMANTQLVVKDRRLVRPLAFLRSPEKFLSPQRETLIGPTHGDLHVGNILIPVDEREDRSEFQLIDFADFSGRRCFVFDAATLCLSYISKSADGQGEDNVISALLLEKTFDREGISKLIDAFSEMLTKVASEHLPGMRAEILNDFQLCLATAALKNSCRAVFSDSRKKFWYVLGAFFLSAIVKPKESDPEPIPYIDSAKSGLEQAVNDLRRTFLPRRRRCQLLVTTSEGIAQAPVTSFSEVWFDIVVTVGDMPDGQLPIDRFRELTNQKVISEASTLGGPTTYWMNLPSPNNGIKSWHRDTAPALRVLIEKLSGAFSGEATFYVDSASGSVGKSIVLACSQELGLTVKVVRLGQQNLHLDEVEDRHLDSTVKSLLDRLGEEASLLVPRAITVPSRSGQIVVDERSRAWYDETLELLTNDTGTVELFSGTFLKGGTISWHELSLGLDRWRPPLQDSLTQRVLDHLEGGVSHHLLVEHFPGSGATTVLRRLAWDMHLSVPTALVQSITRVETLLDRLMELSEATDVPILVVFDGPPQSEIDRIFRLMRSRRRVVIFVSGSRQILGRLESQRRRSSRASAGQKDVFFLDAIRATDDEDFVSRRGLSSSLSTLVKYPAALNDLARSLDPMTPFLGFLVGSNGDFAGLPGYVEKCLGQVSPGDLETLEFICFVHFFGARSVNILTLGPVEDLEGFAVDVWKEHLLDSSVGLLLAEDGQSDYVRPAHVSIAGELLKQRLGKRWSNWELGLADLACDYVELCSEVDPFGIDPSVVDSLESIFVNREGIDPSERKARFSRMIESLPSGAAKRRVFDSLVESFPKNPHYWSHRGRVLDHFLEEFPEAIESISRAIDLSEGRDGLHFHMRAMVYRSHFKRLRKLRGEHSYEHVLSHAQAALDDFSAALKTSAKPEYPLVGIVTIAVDALRFLREEAGLRTYSQLFTSPHSNEASVWLHTAEEAHRDLGIQIPGKPSAAMNTALLRLKSVYDESPELVETLRVALERRDAPKVVVRGLLVAAIVSVAGSTERLSTTQVQECLELLETNLDEDPNDLFSLKRWLRMARSVPVGVPYASELVENWVARSESVEARFYDYVLGFLMLDMGMDALRPVVRAKLQRCVDASQSREFRTFRYEWLGDGKGLNALVPHSEVRDNPSTPLKYLRAQVIRIASPQHGTLRFTNGIEAHFVPANAHFLRGRDEDRWVRATVGFSYDGVKAGTVVVESP